MKDLVKIFFHALPAAAARALGEQYAGMAAEIMAGDTAPLPPDLVISGAAQAPFFPGTPVFAVDFAAPARLGGILRQAGRMLAAPALYLDDMHIGDCLFSPQDKTLTRGEEEIPLTDREVDMLAFLARHGTQDVTREELLKKIWRYQDGVDTHTLETHVYRLRQKTGDEDIVITGDAGYRLKTEPSGI